MRPLTPAQFMARVFLWGTPATMALVGAVELLFAPRPSSLQLLLMGALFLAMGVGFVRLVEREGPG